MEHTILGYITGYVSALLQTAIVLNVANIQWTVKRLIFSVSAIFLPHTLFLSLCFLDSSYLRGSLIAWILLTVVVYRLSFVQSWRNSLFIVAGQYFFLIAGFNYSTFFIINQLPDNVRIILLGDLFIVRTIVIVIYVMIFLYTKNFTCKGYSSLSHLISKFWAFYLFFFLFFVDCSCCPPVRCITHPLCRSVF